MSTDPMSTGSIGPDQTGTGSPYVGAPGPSYDEPRFHLVTSADGTRLRAWTNGVDDPTAPTVLLCNGLGTNAWCWPGLLDPDCGVRVISWNHRGVGGSDRPVDPERVTQDCFVEDALAVMDDAGVAACPMIGWSIGVNTMFELAVTHPERVTGLLAVAGVPGDTFASMLAPLGVPPALAKPVMVGVAHAAEAVGPPFTTLLRHLRVTPGTAWAATHSGFLLPVPDLGIARRAMAEFLTTPVEWYAHIALASSLHGRVSLRDVRVPCDFVAGRYDVLTAARMMKTAAERIPDADYVSLPASHFIPLERPDEVQTRLARLLERVG